MTTRSIPRILALACLLVALHAPAARAEAWFSSMGALLRESRRIEIIQVTAVTDGRNLEGTLAVAVRTPSKVGDRVRVPLGAWMPQVAVAKGDRLLVVCDATQCPRAVGVERAGAFDVIAQEPGDSAAVFPQLVQAAAVPLLADSKPAPALCIRGTFELIDESTPTAFQISISASDGHGSGTLDGAPVDAEEGFGTLLLRSPNGTGHLRLRRDGATAREQDGCYAARHALASPLPRSRGVGPRAFILEAVTSSTCT